MLKRNVLVSSMLGACALFASNANAGFVLTEQDGTTALGPLVQLSDLVDTEFNPTIGTGGVPSTTPSEDLNGNVLSPDQIFGWNNANLFYDNNDEGSYTINFKYIGQESGFDNEVYKFIMGGSTILDESPLINDPGQDIVFDHSSGEAVEFGFRRDDGVNPADNGTNDESEPNFFFGFVGSDAQNLDYSVAYLFYNDSGAGDDADYDDYIVALTNGDGRPWVLIPEPSSLAVFGLGLLGAGFLRRRQTKSESV
ncbi:PEP-CTERM sorting domain-containing protein [Vibrio alfacsensis]|uniref:PEP-CTERM sorting domain-containing protein n=1 Tax=Vibrio alfacsensis TaxID=1074311 RepID=UPI00406829DA